MLSLLVLLGIVVVGWLVKSYIPSYLNKKAENFATREDFQNLLDQEKVTTREVEAIKGQISTAMWIDQRRWDLRRELYYKLLEVFHELRKATAYVAATYSTEQDKELIAQNKAFYDGQKNRQRELLDEAGHLTAVAALIVDASVLAAIDTFRQAASTLGAENDPYKYMMSLCESADRAYRVLLSEARKDLLGIRNAD